MIYAQIKNGIVRNLIVLDDDSLAHLFAEGYDLCIRVDQLDPQPCIFWSYDGENFSAPDA